MNTWDPSEQVLHFPPTPVEATVIALVMTVIAFLGTSDWWRSVYREETGIRKWFVLCAAILFLYVGEYSIVFLWGYIHSGAIFMSRGLQDEAQHVTQIEYGPGLSRSPFYDLGALVVAVVSVISLLIGTVLLVVGITTLLDKLCKRPSLRK
jgi:hypothetical protein